MIIQFVPDLSHSIKDIGVIMPIGGHTIMDNDPMQLVNELFVFAVRLLNSSLQLTDFHQKSLNFYLCLSFVLL